MIRKRIALLLALVLMNIAIIRPTLFEDGSVQIMETPGLGFCLIGSWGCAD